MSEYFTVENGPVTTITFNQAKKHNAFDDAFVAALTRTLKQISKDKNCRVILLKAEGKSFSAGADLNWMKRMSEYSHMENYDDAKDLARLMEVLNNLPQIVIAAVQGPAYGGGVGLVACCDIVVAVESVQFCLSEVKLGLVPGAISPYVIRAIGARQARRYFASAERFSAQKACEIGLVHEVVEDQKQLDVFIEKLSVDLLKGGPKAQQLAKKMALDLGGRPIIDQYVIEDSVKWIVGCRESSEGIEGMSAFLEKRSPQWAKNSDKK